MVSPWARKAELELSDKDLLWCQLHFATKKLLTGQIDKLYNHAGKFRRINISGRVDLTDPKNIDIADMAIIFCRDDGMLIAGPSCQEEILYKKFEKRWVGFVRIPFMTDDRKFKPMAEYDTEDEYTPEDYAVIRFLTKILGS